MLMHPIISRSLGGLSFRYYFRQLFFGFVIAVLSIFMQNQTGRPLPVFVWVFFIINTFLYPYSRFVYERIIGFILGENVFYVNTIVMLVVKYITMSLCWGLALLIAPIGLVWLYFYHTREINSEGLRESEYE
jgi:hypothetical protein